MIDNTVYVLLATFNPDPDPIPSECWTFSDLAAADDFLRGWAKDFLYVNNLPDAELVAVFRNAGAHILLFECELDGEGGDELEPFMRVPEHVS